MSDFDLIIAANMTGATDRGLRVALEARCAANGSRRVGLVNLAAADQNAISPDIQACVTRGLAHPIGPADPVTTTRLTLYCEDANPRDLGDYAVHAGRIDVVFDTAQTKNPKPLQTWLARRADEVVWAARDTRLAGLISAKQDAITLATGLWEPVVPQPATARSGTAARKFAVGHIGAERLVWPTTIEDLSRALPSDGSIDVLFFGPPPPPLLRFPHRWKVFDEGEMSILRFLERLDALVVLDPNPALLPRAAIAWMLGQGRLVLVPHTLPGEAQIQGALPVAPEDIPATIRHRIAEGLGLPPDPIVTKSRRQTSARSQAPPAQTGDPVPVLFVASNGIGLGHVTRLLAIARRCRAVEPVFVVMSPVAAMVESYGYTAHYVPSPKYISADLSDWDQWFQTELEATIDLTNARLVAYDGNVPTLGMVRAAGSRGADLVWVRGGMIGSARMPMIENDRFCDAVVEPGELAEANDSGATRFRRDGVDVVDPILLLDREELLPREEARRSLGLDLDRPAALIHLGSTTNRDVASIIDQLMPALRRQAGLQIVIADWFVGDGIEPVWEGVRYMRGHPFSRYFHAFDFSFAAAGYNTFHEVISAGLPTVFIANKHPSMDDQDGRSRFAEAAGLALRLDPETMPQLDEMVAVLMNDVARSYLRSKCDRLRRTNGAITAAHRISHLATREAGWTWPKP